MIYVSIPEIKIAQNTTIINKHRCLNGMPNNSRIARNTFYLYIRMILVLIVSLYTSRIVLSTLGITDYGVYNVVGGIVTMLSFFSNNLSTAVSRFITFELGKEHEGKAEEIFRCSNTIFIIFAIIVFVLAETIGLWFVKNKLNIPSGRELAAFWTYQCSVVTFMVSLLSSAYNALIIAHERMQVFAYITLYEVIMKLLVVYILAISPFDRLVTYAILILIVQISVRGIYTCYCSYKFVECNHRLLWESKISKRILGFTTWTLSSGIAVIGYNQGLNILLNMFYGPVVNAARAIASQVQSAVSLLFNNFQIAIRPEVIKLYAKGELLDMYKTLLRGAKLSVYLSLLLAIPIFVYSDQILSLWLKDVPDYASIFVKLTVIASCFTALSQHTFMAIHATGDIKKFQLIESACLLSILPIAYIIIKFLGVSPVYVLSVYVIVEGLTNLVRVHMSYKKIHLSTKLFYVNIVVPIIKVLLVSCIPVGLIYYLDVSNSTFSFLLCFLLSCILIAVSIFFVGLDNVEKVYIRNIIINIFNKR